MVLLEILAGLVPHLRGPGMETTGNAFWRLPFCIKEPLRLAMRERLRRWFLLFRYREKGTAYRVVRVGYRYSH